MATGKALFLRNMPTEIIREAKAAAARRGQTLTAVVADALSRSLRMEDEPQRRDHGLEADIAWFRSHRTELVRRYRGEYVAIVDKTVVDHGRDFDALATRVFGHFGNRDIYMPRVEASEPEARVRSPKRAKP